jgi:hypothetical protein
VSAPPDFTEALLCGLMAVAMAHAWPVLVALIEAMR